MNPLVQIIIVMFCAVGLSILGHRRQLLRAGFKPNELYDYKDGMVNYYGEEKELGTVKREAISALCAFPRRLVVISYLLILTVFIVMKIHYPGMTMKWLDMFLVGYFPHTGYGLLELLRDSPETFVRFHGLYTKDILNTLIAVAMLLSCSGFALFVPLRRKCTGMAVFNIWMHGRELSARQVRVRKLLYITAVFMAGMMFMWPVGIYGTCIICFRSMFI